MSQYLDSAVIVASLVPDDPDHAVCHTLLRQSGNLTTLHALHETFSTLTGGRLGIRVDAGVAARLIRDSIVPLINIIPLTIEDILETQAAARARGVRGGAIYDFQHLTAARKAGAGALFTLNHDDFAALFREGNPAIRRP